MPGPGGTLKSMEPKRPPEMTAYPVEAAQWLVGSSPATVVLLGHPDATRDLAAVLLSLGHDVRNSLGTDFALADGSADVVIAVGHQPDDLESIAKLVWPRGYLSIVLADRDRRIPWVKKFDRIFGCEDAPDPRETFQGGRFFAPLETERFRFWQWVDKDRMLDLARSLPEVVGLGDESRKEKLLAQVAELYDSYGRARDGMQVPWVSNCYRAHVLSSAADYRRPVPTETGASPVALSAQDAAAFEADTGSMKPTSGSEDPEATQVRSGRHTAMPWELSLNDGDDGDDDGEDDAVTLIDLN